MNPSPKTVFSEIFDEMFANIVKTTNEFKIHSWKRRAEKIKEVDIFEYKLLISILLSYENKFSEALKMAESLLPITTSPIQRAMVLRTMGNINFIQLGGYLKSKDLYWEAYELTHDESYFQSCLLVATNFDLYDSRLEDMSTLNSSTKQEVQKKLNGLQEEINDINQHNLNIDIYREIMNHAYVIFFSHCSRQINRFPLISDSNISTILFNDELDISTVEFLNDKMNEALVNLLDKYDYEELLKYPVLFTAEDYSKRKY
ncbi:hypothetical protein EA709_15020 [Acinetobacter baumannii]|uniref:hypothetical protein n=1 Tax=Acinetobacter baumannii TaxID=470 RepID=UPI0002BAC316|nr:hypothetical protein [Acinetobacter baumannii]RSQ25093.1 hypothetical protein EA709_15020 [Acinetobacter baumannii]